MRFIKPSLVRKYVRPSGKRVSRSFLLALDAFVQRKLDEAVKVHDGGKKTLDASIAGFVGVKP